MANLEKRCMGCMSPLPDDRQECGVCGYPAGGINPDGYLQVRTLLSGRYLVGRVLEAGGDSALYVGYDQVQEAPVSIREFFPETLCGRGENGQVTLLAGCEVAYGEMLDKFRSHARVLARLRDLPTMIPLYDIFEENGTAYTVSEKVGGVTLAARLRQSGGRMSWDEARPLFMPLFAALSAVHSAGIYHLGICPENILLGSDGRPHFQNFLVPEAHMVGTDLKPQLMAGYAAPEQYELEQRYTAATDVYGMAATIFAVLTGSPPADGAARARESADLLMPADVAKELPPHVKTALFHALQVSPDKRIPTVDQLRERLSAAPSVTALLREEPKEEKQPVPEPEKEPEKPKKHSRLKIGLLIFLAVFIVLLLFAFGILLLLFPDMMSGLFGGGGNASSTLPISSTAVIPSTTPASSQAIEDDPLSYFAVTDVVGKNYYDIKENKLNGDMPLEVLYKQYSDKPAGTILSQEPAAEERAKKGTAVKVVISDGPRQREVPDVSGWTEQHAKAYLEALGYRVKVIYLEVSSFDKGLVQETSPAKGSKVEEGDTIDLRVSNQEQTPPPTSSDGGIGWPW